MNSPQFSDDQVLQEALLDTLFVTPELPGRLQVLNIAGVRGYVSNSTNARANGVYIDTSAVESVDEIIQQVIAFFAAEGKGFQCLVLPDDDPAGRHLALRLEAAGMKKVYEMIGMVLHGLPGPAYGNQDVQVREVGGAEMVRHSELIRNAYGTTQEAAELIALEFSPDRRDRRFRAYLAYLDGKAVGFAYLRYLPGMPLANLRMAGTLEAYRRQGVYHTLVARRLADAHADGMQSAIISSMKGTSTSTLVRYGFRAFCNMSQFRWEAI